VVAVASRSARRLSSISRTDSSSMATGTWPSASPRMALKTALKNRPMRLNMGALLYAGSFEDSTLRGLVWGEERAAAAGAAVLMLRLRNEGLGLYGLGAVLRAVNDIANCIPRAAFSPRSRGDLLLRFPLRHELLRIVDEQLGPRGELQRLLDLRVP